MNSVWRSPLARALHYHREPHARYVQLATIDPEGMPRNRTIVFRGFLHGTDTLQFVTDKRSRKVTDIQTKPYGEVCWYFPKTREQFRLFGSLILIDYTDPDRVAMWQELSSKAKAQFLWAEPGMPRLPETKFLATYDNPSPPDNFCLLLLRPTTVDHLNLRGHPQTRTIYQYQTSYWTAIAVNP